VQALFAAFRARNYLKLKGKSEEAQDRDEAESCFAIQIRRINIKLKEVYQQRG